nr:hypothetical protein [Tanacetum cinerariifolium]
MPSGKIGVYTRFFEYANFRLPLSTFFVDVLRYYHIHISQLSVIGAAKVSHFEILCGVHGFELTVSKGVPKDPFPKSFEFNAEHYAILVAHPAPFHKYPEPFLCLVGISRYYTLDENTYLEFLGDNDEEMGLISFIRTADPTKVRVAERQRVEDEPRLLETTIGRVVPLLPVAPARASIELEASVDKLFDERASGDGQGTDIQPVIATTDTIVEDVASLQPRRQRKRKNVVADASGPSHPPNKLREDYGALGGASTAGKSRSAVQGLFTGAVLNVEARGEPIPTFPFVTSSVSATPDREDKSPADSVTDLTSEPLVLRKGSLSLQILPIIPVLILRKLKLTLVLGLLLQLLRLLLL